MDIEMALWELLRVDWEISSGRSQRWMHRKGVKKGVFPSMPGGVGARPFCLRSHVQQQDGLKLAPRSLTVPWSYFYGTWT